MLNHHYWHSEKMYHLKFFSASNLVACGQVDESVYYNNAYITAMDFPGNCGTAILQAKMTQFGEI